MQIYNTLTKKKERITKKKLNIFVCGPTVYGPTHLGHAKTILTFDILIKYLRSIGYSIFYLQNITDIDDKIIKKANETSTNPKRVAKEYTREYMQVVKKLNINAVNKYAPATHFIPQIIKQIKKLIEKGYAYKITDGYYFDIAKFKEYGKLANRTVTQADDGVSRIDENEEKKSRGDFCLWKFRKPNEPYWPSPLGEGRPGWHIEDTAITEHFFGPQYDIHGGGSDLIFPHHEAEIAQQEAASGKKPFVKYWLHTGMVIKDGRKMSKSLGNFETAESFIDKHGALIFRIIVALHHYRNTLDINQDALNQGKAVLESITLSLAKLNYIEKNKIKKTTISEKEIKQTIKKVEKKFHASMADDFNTREAFSSILELVNYLDKIVWKMNSKNAQTIHQSLKKLLNSLGITIEIKNPPKSIEKTAVRREELRKTQQFEEADKLREQLNNEGYTVDDTPLGPMVRVKV